MLRALRAGGAFSLVILASALSACASTTRPVEPTTAAAAHRETPEAVAPSESAAKPPTQPLKELPRGGRAIFPEHRLVGFCGTPNAPALGSLMGNLPARAKALETRAAPYAQGRKLLPVFELIAVVVQAAPGADGKYRHRVDDSVIDEYLRVARESKALLLLNVQPGHSDFMTEVKTFEKYLREPDVGLALDPEWAMKGKQQPGIYYGQTTGEVLNDVAAFLSNIIEQDDLPEKALVFHQVNRLVLKDESAIAPHPGVVVIKSVDGLGPVHSKMATYGALMATMVAGVHPGFKLFFDEDTRIGDRLMTPQEVLALSPQPEYVMYE
jgi:hypothetical protein